MNVHPGETLADLHAALSGPVARIASRYTDRGPFAAGLWLSAATAHRLDSEPGELETLAGELDHHRLRAFTVNAFPYGGFHDPIVKRGVYRPDWTHQDRRDYSLAVARVLAALIPEGSEGSISTLPLSFKAFPGNKARELSAIALAEATAALSILEKESGRRIALALEPEPFAILETSAECIRFFEDILLPLGIPRIVAITGGKPEDAEELLRRHCGICFDTCHLACQWESLPNAVRAIAAAGIRIVKTQISVALELRQPAQNPEGVARLRSFAEARYLHQTIAKNGLRAEDLPAIFRSDGGLEEPWSKVEALRTHFHVPIFWRGDAALATTRPELKGLSAVLLEAGCRHFEVETYSWEVVPEAERRELASGVEDMLARELDEALALFEEA